MEYDFFVLLCAFPVITLDGLVRIGQSAFSNLLLILKIFFISKIIEFLIAMFSKPFYIAGLVLLLAYFPDTVQWVFMQIGLIQIKIFMLLLTIVLPEIFKDLNVESYADIFNQGINALPTEIVEVCASLGVAENMGLIVSCLGAGWIIRIYLNAMNRAGL